MSAIARDWKAGGVHDRGWTRDFSRDEYFQDCYTIDPQEVEAAWDKLSQDTRALELMQLPALLHRAFVSAVAKRLGK